jgi:hypothetical protein
MTPTAEPEIPSPQVAAELRASVNGSGPSDDIIHVGAKGRRKVQIGDLPVFVVDVIAVTNAWTAADRQFRDEKGEVPPEKRNALNKAAYDFVSALCGARSPADLSYAMAIEFLAVMTKESIALHHFFAVRSPEEPSSPGSSASIVFDSTPGPSVSSTTA